ncbi:ABC transporter permease [Pontibacillus halophilus JSM 076056 = DSM 19796]|uniref:ABC transporter permease n=1 Tax=Pontibacillus halophilus JSM 076056 = DSM 19796 TaxID=1385510 RepID=A0A0A5GK24_9BACI|nr:sugar ABC transporter permease [Pontibacillus halophilus]KGX91553.1 ABC transporter permease [Pontibacillus halophilus JSM 076056 = DSM 19796]
MNKRRFSLSEKQLGYVMVAPSLVLIAVIVLWPIALSFWNSLFDYRLNDPALSQRTLGSEVNLERYADNYDFVNMTMDELLQSSINDETTTAVSDIEEGLNERHETFLSTSEHEEKYEEVLETVQSHYAVKDESLKYVSIDEELKEEYSTYLTSESDRLASLSNEQSGEAARLLSELSGQMKLMESSFMKENFVGLSNYTSYFQESRLWQSIGVTSLFTVVSVFFELILGLAIALLINRAFIGRGAVRASVLIPWAIPTAVSAMIWKFLYDGQSGVIAHYFEQLGFIQDAGQLLTTSAGAIFSVIFSDVWKTTPYMALLLLAGLQTIPHQLYESAQVDGANAWHRFYKITLPMLKSTILVALLFRTLDAFRVFDLIYVLTGGGPANATEAVSVYAYKILFAQQNFGAGSALSVVVFICVAIISTLFIRFIGSDLFSGKVKG